MTSKLNQLSKDFWKEAGEHPSSTWVDFIDGEPVTLHFEDWNVVEYDSPWGKKPALKVKRQSGAEQILKIEAKKFAYTLFQHVGKKVILVITRYDSKPNSANTWYDVALVEES